MASRTDLCEKRLKKMAASANKRRKIEHQSSSEDSDDASFASFGDSEDLETRQENEWDDEELDGYLSGESDGESLEKSLEDHESEVPIDDESSKANGNAISAEADRRPSERSARAAQQQKALPKRVPNERNLRGSTYTAGTFKSNMFKLQVDELLGQTRPRHGKKETEAEAALHKLKKAIESFPSREPLSVDDAERQLLMSSKVAVPFPNPRPSKDVKYKLEHAKPTNLNVVGSYALKTASRSKKTVEIDMVVTMPSSLFREKDYLDFRYFYKRAYYLACIASGLKESCATDFDIRFQNFHDDQLKPFLAITPRSQSSGSNEVIPRPKWQINVLPSISDNIFPHEKLLLDRHCVRKQYQAPTNGTLVEEARTATPFYNSSLRSDMLMTAYLKVLHAALKACESFQDACLLSSTWLRQRGFGPDLSAGGFGNFELSVLMALLLHSGGPGGKSMLSEGYSSYQLLKATLQLLAMKDFSKQPLTLGPDQGSPKSVNHDVPVVWDSTRSHNLLYKMTPWSYKMLRQEAKTTLNSLADRQFDGFDAAFILRTDRLLYRYDYIMEIDPSFISDTNMQNGHTILEKSRKLYNILQQGLGDRVSYVNIIPQRSESWELSSTGRDPSPKRKLLVGFMVNPGNVNRTIDHGPSAEEKTEAAAFRKFWGEKAELRRFKDGSIQESLIWSGKEGGRSVLEQIVRYVVETHFGDEIEQDMKFFGDGFQKMLPQNSGMAAFQSFTEAFKQLESDIRSLDGLPLSLRQIMPVDPQLRYTWMVPPSGVHQSMPADVIIQFEGSTRWPDDLVAIQRTKIAFLLKVKELLQDTTDTLTARIGLENGEHDILNQGFLDVVYDSGVAFRLRIHHDREQTLLERTLKDKALDPRSKEVAALGLAKYKRDYVKTPSHTQAIAGLCSRHPAMSGTIRLTKKWFASHLLSNHIAEEVVELLVARTFTQPWPWQAPSSTQTGFMRTLFWLSRWHWRADPLVVDLSGSSELKQPELQSISTKFEAWRKLDPALNRVVLFAASTVDHDGTTWTDGRCPKVVAGRMTALAKAACNEVEDKGLSLEPGSLFTSPLGDFNFVIHLRPESGGKKSHRQSSGKNGVAFKNLELDLMDDSSRIGFDPVSEYTREIESLYGSAILLFSGGQERPVIAGLWHPQTALRPWKLNLAYSTTPFKRSDQDEVQAEVNKEAILAEIARLGADMIQSIEVNSP